MVARLAKRCCYEGGLVEALQQTVVEASAETMVRLSQEVDGASEDMTSNNRAQQTVAVVRRWGDRAVHRRVEWWGRQEPGAAGASLGDGVKRKDKRTRGKGEGRRSRGRVGGVKERRERRVERERRCLVSGGEQCGCPTFQAPGPAYVSYRFSGRTRGRSM